MSGITALQNLPSTSIVTFRIVPYNASGAGGTWYIYDTGNNTNPDLAVTGTVSACPTITATLNGTTTICTGSSTNLNATITGGTGPYSLTISNGTVNVPVNNYTSGANTPVSPTSDKTYTIVAATDANACPVTINGSGATVTVKQTPTAANAGASQTITSGNTATLAANAPTTGTGMWSVSSGPSTVSSQFSSTNSPTAIFTPAGGLGNYVLTWTISNAPCTPSSSNVTITVSPPTCGTLTVPGNYSSIQAAINAACAGALIQVAAGTYTEQLTITKSLSIVGAGVGNTTIKAPTMLAVGGPDEGAPYIKRNIVEIKGTSAVTLSGLKVNGPVTGQDGCGTDAFGIYVYDNSSLALSNADITNAQLSDPSLFGCQVGFALGVGLTGSPGSATLTNVTMSNYQKGGILARGAGTVLVADNITVTGIGATTATAQNGIQVSSGASATITNSSITNNSYVTPTGSTFYTASGIITYNSGPVTISGSTFTGNDVGLDAEGTGTTNVTNNIFSQSSYASIYTDQVMTLTSSGNTFDKQVTNSAKTGTIYSTIQGAIDDATANNVLTAAAGTFAEDIYVDKAVTLHGANTGIDPNTGSRVAETIIVPATAGSDVFYLADGLTGVTIDGFTIDGNNPALNGTTINGSNVDASTGISSYSSVVSSVKINNNIIQNFADYGIVLDPSSNGGVPATGGHEITHNKIDNIGQGSGIGVLLQNNAYTVVTNNVISRIRSGIQTGNFYQTAPAGTTPSLSNNQISAQRAGIFHNLQYSAATPFMVANNTLSVDASGASFSVVPRAGMLLISLGVPTTVSNNTVNNGFTSGVEALNNVGNVTLSGGAVQGNTSGILLTNKDVVGNTASTGSKLLVSGVTVSNSLIGIKVFDDPTAPAGPNASITVTDNTQISGSGAFTAVAISGVDASATITGNASSFVGNGSGTGVDINGGAASVTADRITNFAIGISVSNGGQLTNAANNFITGNSTGVAYAANASSTQGPVNNNDLSGNTSKAITNGLASTTIGATCNWYGTVNVDAQAASLFTGAVTYSPYLNSGTDNDGNSNTGFQPVPGACVSNQPPVASTIANQTATVGQVYNFTVPAFSDPENQTLTYTASINPANGLTFDPATRVISGTTTATGVSTVIITATDPGSMSASQTFTITVNPVPCPQSVTNVTTGETFCTIQAAINAPNTATGHTINVGAGTYNEQVLVNKSVSIVGIGSPKPVINFTGTPGLASNRLTLFEVTVPNVTIQNLKFTPDLTKVGSAILASVALPGSVSGLTVQNNDINPYRSGGLVSYGLRNAVSINYADFRVNGSNPSNLLMTGNTITYNDNGTAGNAADDAGFRSGFATDEGGGTFTGNTIQTVNQDIQARFGSAGAINVTNNNINGGGVELAEYNAGAASVMVTGNNFNGTFGSTFTSSLRLKNNQQAIPTTVSGNNFTGHNLGISLENYQAVTVDNNIFTPATGSTTYQHITVNTKEFSSSSGAIPPAISLTLTNNTFNGSSSPTSGTALAFANQDNDNPTFGPFVLGTAGNENKFGAGLGTFIYLVNATGTVNPNATPAAPFAINLNVINDLFDVGSGLKLPQALTSGERATLETKLFHKPDVAALGLITYFYPVRNVTQSSSYSTIQSAIDAANANDVIELAEYTFNEHPTVTKPLTITGVSQTGTIIDGTGPTVGNGFTLQDNVAGIKIGNLTIRRQSGSANTTGNGIYGKTNNDLTVTNVTSVSNAVHGIILETSGTLTNVSVTSSTLSSNGIGNGGRGFIIFNNLKQNITLSNNLIQNNGLTGIDINEGTATGVTITGNTITGNGDEGVGLLGALETGGANLIDNNTITNNGRYGIEVKSSIGTGATSGAGSLVISNNTISRTADLPGSRDIAGISVTRRGAGVSVNTRETPQGAVVQNNTVTGYVNSGTGDGFGIVVEGVNYQVTGNTASGNDVGLQEQQTSIGQRNRTNGTPSDGDSPYDVSDYFDRGNSIYSCGVVTNNTLTGNTLATRAVGQTAAGRGLVTNTNTGATYCTIQAAVDAATAGNTLVVSAGTYPESVTVTKGLTINGAQVGIDPRTGRTGGESIVTAPGDITADGNLFTVRANNVVIDGFTIDGDSPAVTGGTAANGADINARRGISNGNNGSFNFALDGLTVRNNIIKNILRSGVTLLLENQAPNVAMNNVLVTQNLFDNVRAFGVYGEDNCYVSVVNNKMTQTRSGIGIFTIGTAYPSGTPQITGNDITTEETGLYYNNFASFGPPAVGTATPFNVANNIFRSIGTTNVGLRIYSLFAGGHTFTNNTAIGTNFGALVWNTPGVPTISGGALDGKTAAVRLTNYETYDGFGDGTTAGTVSGVSITNSPIGVQAFDDPAATSGTSSVTVTGNTQITGSATFTAVAISGTDASANITGNASSFVGNGSGVGVDVNGGTASVTANRIANFATGINVSNGGQLTSVANNFITGNTDGIVYAANAGTTQGVVTINDLSGNTDKAIINGLASTIINANCNYFGAPTATTNPTYVTGNVSTTQVLANNTDEDTSAPGFQNTSCFTPPTAPVLTATPPANPQGGSYNATYCIGENPTVTSNYTTGVNSFTVQSLSDGSTTVTTGNSVTINQGAGTYFVYATNTQNGYTSPVSATTTIQVQPGVTSFTSSKAAYCVGETVSLTALGCNVATASQPNLYFVRLRQLDGSNNPNLGTANLASGVNSYTYTQFGTATTTSYTITAECVNGGTGNVCSVTELAIIVNPLPTSFSVTGGGAYCAGGTGVPVGLSGSESGVSYQLYNGNSAVGTPVAGTGSAFDFPSVTAAGTYSVLATNTATSCQTAMTGSATVSIIPTAAAPVLTASAPANNVNSPNASYCIGENPTVTSDYTTGVNSFTVQSLSDGSTTVTTGSSVTITQGAGTYFVYSTNTQSNGCTSPVSATTTIRIQPNVTSFTASKTTYCVGETVSLTALGCNVAASPQSPLYFVRLRALDGSNNPNQGTVNLAYGVNSYTYTPSFAPATTTSYTITAECVNGGTGSVCSVRELTLTANPVPTATLVSSNSLNCSVTSTTLTATGGQTYAFAGPGVVSQDPASGTAVANVGGLYSVTVTSAGGCTSMTTTTVASDTAVPTATLMASGTLTCNQTSVTLTAGGGISYVFSGTGIVSQDVSGTAVVSMAGVYSVTATAANGCTDTKTRRVFKDTDKPTATLTASGSGTLTCNQTSLTLTASASGGTAPFTYAFSTDATQVGGTNMATVTTAGLYSVTVTGSNGCSDVANVRVYRDAGKPTASLTASGSGTLTCNQTSLTLTASATGGSSPYTYLFSPDATTISATQATVTTAGLYSVTATGTNGCFDVANVRVYRDAGKPTASLTASGSGTLTCNQTSLALTASATGGSTPYTYAFSADATQVGSTNMATVTTAGLYSVTVTGSNGCSDVANVRVYRDAGKPTATLTVNGSGTLTCNQTSLTLTASATPGTSYTYSFSPDATPISATQATVTTAGLYSVTATGSNGCSDVANVRVYRDASKPTASLTASNSGTLTCNQTSLTLTASASGGTAPFTYAFSADATQVGSTNMATVTTAGLYSVTVTGSNGCSDVANVRVYRDAGKPTASLTASGSGTLTCAQTSLTLTASATGGTSPYTYLFGPDATTISATQATVTTAGLYSVTATGTNGCFDVANVRVYRDAGKPTASLTASGSGTLTCNQTSLALTASATGGSTPYTYAFSADATQVGSTNMATVTTAGLYSVTVTGSNGCSDVANVRVYRDAGKPTATLTASGSGTLTCNQTSLTLTASATGGTAPYTYLFSPDATTISATEATVTTAGLYSVTAIGANGCFDVANVRVYRDRSQPTASLVASGTLNCNQTTVTLTAGTGAGYSYSFSSGATQIGTSNQATVTTAGLYSVTVTANNGCSSFTSVNVMAEPLPTLSGATQVATVCPGSPATVNLTGLPENASLTVNYTINGVAQPPASVTTSNSSMGWAPSDPIPFQTRPLTAADNGTTLTITSIAFVSSGCSQTFNTGFALQVNPTPAATLSASGTLTCAQTSVTLTATSGAGYTYVFSSGATQLGTSNQATVTTAGPYSVTITSGSGCMAVAMTTVSSSTSLVTPDFATWGNQNIPDGQTNVTVVQNTAPVSFNATNCSGTLTWSGNNQTGTGVLNAPTSATGVFVYQATCTVGSCVSNPASVTLTVTPANTAPTPTINSNQTATVGVAFSYQVNAFTDAETPNNLTYSASINPANGLSFDPVTRVISGTPVSTGVSTVVVKATDPGSLSASTSFTITVNPVPVVTNLTVLSRDPENGNLNTNTIKPYLLLQNDGSTPIPYGELTVRYYLTVENNVPLRFDINYAQMGNDKVHLQYVPLNPARQGATGYIEFSFDASAGSLAPMSNAVIQDLINKQDYSMFFQGDDYSYVNNANFTANPHITAYRNGVLVYGVEPVPTGPPTPLTLTASANPTTILTTGSTQLQANVSGGTPGYTYTFSGPGNIQPSGNTATVSGLPAGVQTFTVTARDATSPVNQTIATTVSVTVNAPANQAPVASANANQTATQGVSFSYTVGAFSDDTPNSLTYTASINPANGFTFNPATRVVQGTPQNTGVSSVTITATDPGGLSASTVFTITVNAQPVAPTALTLTASANPTTILTTGTTTLSATASGGTPGYTYVFNGPGTIQPNGNTATVSGLPAGVQTFTVTARDATSPVNQTIATTVSVTVNAPANQPPVATDNANQTATQGMPFSYTANAFTDETPNSLTYTASINPANSFTFNPATRAIQGTPQNTGVSSVTITATDPGGLSASTIFTITVNASAVAPATNLTVYSRDPDNGQLNTNTLKPYLQLQNDGNTPIPYGELTVRYWLTVENPAPLRYDINYAQLGSDKVHLNYVPVSPLRQGASGYIEFSFDASAGSLGAMSNSGPIQDLINKQDYSYFFQGDDYSYVNTGNFTPNPHITAYRNGVLVYGVEPPVNVRLAAEQADAPLRVEVLGNPLVGGELAVKVTGAAGQSLRLRVTDLNGHLVNERMVERAGTVEEQRLSVSQQAAGLLFLQVSTPNQTLTVKVLKAD